MCRNDHSLDHSTPWSPLPLYSAIAMWLTEFYYYTTGFQARSRGGRWSWTLKLAQKRSWAGRWNWAAKVGLLSLRSQACNTVQRTLSLWLCTAVETAVARCTSRCTMARGHRLNTFIVLAAVHCLSGLFRAVSAVEPSLFRPPPPPQGQGHAARVSRIPVKQQQRKKEKSPWPLTA